MKFVVPNYSCFQSPWLGGCRPQIPVLSVLCPQLNLLNPPTRNKIPGYATGTAYVQIHFVPHREHYVPYKDQWLITLCKTRTVFIRILQNTQTPWEHCRKHCWHGYTILQSSCEQEALENKIILIGITGTVTLILYCRQIYSIVACEWDTIVGTAVPNGAHCSHTGW